MLDNIREAIAAYCAEFGKMPGVVYMSETAYKETVAFFRKNGFAIWFDDLPSPERPVTLYGAKVEIVPYPDNLVIVGGIKVNV